VSSDIAVQNLATFMLNHEETIQQPKGHCQVEQISRVDAKWAALNEVASSCCHGLPDGERSRP
jgi:hypothetical protein